MSGTERLYFQYLERLEAMHAAVRSTAKDNRLNPLWGEYLEELYSEGTKSILGHLWVEYTETRGRILQLDPEQSGHLGHARRETLRATMERYELQYEKIKSEVMREDGKRLFEVGRKWLAGHVKAHGTPEKKQERWATLQQEVDAIRLIHPQWPKSEVERLAAKKCGCDPRTIRRHCTVPPAKKK